MILPSSIPDSRHRFGLSGRILTNSSLRMQPNSAAHIKSLAHLAVRGDEPPEQAWHWQLSPTHGAHNSGLSQQ